VEALLPYLRHQRVIGGCTNGSHTSRVVLAILPSLNVWSILDYKQRAQGAKQDNETATVEQENSETPAANSEHDSPLLCSPSTSVPPYRKETRFALV
jgi:hypothetical protein